MKIGKDKKKGKREDGEKKGRGKGEEAKDPFRVLYSKRRGCDGNSQTKRQGREEKQIEIQKKGRSKEESKSSEAGQEKQKQGGMLKWVGKHRRNEGRTRG